MRRVIKFTSENTKHFLFMYEGFLAGGNLAPREARSADVKRRERKILRALRGVSTAREDKECYPGTEEKPRELVMEPGLTKEVEFEQSELDLLTRYMESVPWTMTLVDKAMDAVDFVSSADRLD